MDKIVVKHSHKLFMENVYTGEKRSILFYPSQEIFGRIDKINGKFFLTLEEGWGGVCNVDLYENHH